MHLVLLNQYYPPDEAPTGLMLEAVAAALVEAGHRVTVLCAEGGYAGTGSIAKCGKPEPLDGESPGSGGVKVIRIGATKFGRGTFVGKLADYASYYVGVAWRLLTLDPKPDRVVSLTTPPYLSVIARLVTKVRGGDHAHWVMDLYPDVMISHGMLRENGMGHRLLAGLARFGFGGKRSAAVVTLGPDMAERVSRHLVPGGTVDWVPLWATGEEVSSSAGEARKSADDLEREGRELRKERGWADDELILMYSGNMGLGHRFSEFLAAAKALSQAGNESLTAAKSRFVFFGGGKRRGEIEAFMRQHPEAPIELHDYVPRHLLAAHLRSADIHLASLEPSWTGTMLPSKLQGIFAAARPVIFVGDPASSTVRWIEESGGGWVVEADVPEVMAAALGEASVTVHRQRAGLAAEKYSGMAFDAGKNSQRIAGFFQMNR